MGKIKNFSFITIVFVLSLNAYSGDCPRFRGPNGDGKFEESGLLKEWPEGGPKLAWSVDGLGKGYSSAVVANGTIYVTGMDEKQQGYLFAFNMDGTPKWKSAYGRELGKSGPAVAGTRGTPTIDTDRIFVMTGFGKLVSFEPEKGEIIKTIDLCEKFGAEQARFGFAECVLVDGKKVVCTPGGPDASLVALDKDTGKTIWQTKGLNQQSACCSARLINHAGKKQIVTMLDNSVVAVEPETGNLLWQAEHKHRAGVQPNPPLYEDGMLYISSGMGAGGEMLEIAEDGMSVTSKWTDRTLDCQMQGTVLIDGYIYGTAQSGGGGLVCLELKTGKVMWKSDEFEKGVVVCADGMLYVYAEDGTMQLIKPDPQKFTPVSKFTVTMGTDEHWAHPTIANGRLYIRHGDTLMAYDIR
jgi:outer membrane protein assembly factor BamB